MATLTREDKIDYLVTRTDTEFEKYGDSSAIGKHVLDVLRDGWRGFSNLTDAELDALLPDDLYQCQDCRTVMRREDGEDVANPGARFEVGDTYTDRQCPECGALAFPVGNASDEPPSIADKQQYVLRLVQTEFPGAEISHTGGGCTALEIAANDGGFWWITDDAASPDNTNTPLCVGLYWGEESEHWACFNVPHLQAALLLIHSLEAHS